MQRGSGGDRKAVSSAQLYAEGAKIKLSSADMPHFDRGGGTEDFLAKLSVAVRHLSNNGFRKPVDVARGLNKQRLFTACERPWTPRLAWMLLNKIYSGAFDGPAMRPVPRPPIQAKNTRPLIRK